ncbi:LOW QUALITY PROTEIN: hypothetical protein Cgig2_028173 [Carnegiea gigantea]|uniref:Uncharacterized protein n=1 Tax=Carnegiea gigantea TaxID=171969 RepID=A0A9Q1JJ73_9CARY|nr:LOW QUALITY PROTEIN: hypothetical protein Cgig2_028173 [Carnegiea gigantea]
MNTMTDTLLQQVIEQVKNTMEAMSSMRPLPTFDYMPIDASRPTGMLPLNRCTEVTMCERSHSLGGMDDPPRGTMTGRLEGMLVRSSGLNKPFRRPFLSLRIKADRSLLKERPTVPSQGPQLGTALREECSTKVVATIAGEYTECITCTAWKTQMRGMQ